MEKINFIFKGNSSNVDWSFMKDIYMQNIVSHIYTPEINDNEITEYSKFKKLYYQEVELLMASYVSGVNFFLLIKPSYSFYLEIYKSDICVTCLISCFFDAIELSVNGAKNKLDILRKISSQFSRNYNFDEFICKLYEEDEDYYFNQENYGRLYTDLNDESSNII